MFDTLTHAGKWTITALEGSLFDTDAFESWAYFVQKKIKHVYALLTKVSEKTFWYWFWKQKLYF